MLLSSPIPVPFRERLSIFGSIHKCTKKITAVKKWPDAFLRSTEISQTRLAIRKSQISKIASLKHEKFQPFRFEERPGGHFFKAERACVQALMKR